jgi:hypothetical protein
MSLHSLPSVLNQSPSPLHSLSFDPPCALCNRSVPLEDAVTEEHGLAIHEACYLRKLGVQRAPSVLATWRSFSEVGQ